PGAGKVRPPMPLPIPDSAQSRAPEVAKDDVLDLADLQPAKRSSPLAGAGQAKPAPKSLLAEAGKVAGTKPVSGPGEEADLLAPKGTAAGPAIVDLPAPKRGDHRSKEIVDLP